MQRYKTACSIKKRVHTYKKKSKHNYAHTILYAKVSKKSSNIYKKGQMMAIFCKST